jgi:hypothetical protein
MLIRSLFFKRGLLIVPRSDGVSHGYGPIFLPQRLLLLCVSHETSIKFTRQWVKIMSNFLSLCCLWVRQSHTYRTCMPVLLYVARCGRPLLIQKFPVQSPCYMQNCTINAYIQGYTPVSGIEFFNTTLADILTHTFAKSANMGNFSNINKTGNVCIS